MGVSSGATGEPARRPVSGTATPTLALTGAAGCSRAATSRSACRDGSPPWSHDYTSFMHTHARVAGMLARPRGPTIVAGEIEATRTVQGYRIARAEALRLGRERIEAEA